MKYEYAVIGAGPSGIAAVLRILELLITTNPEVASARILAKQILWIDEKFTVGAFGNEWKNVPGNTEAQKYRSVYREMLAILKKYGFETDALHFEIDDIPDYFPCFLKIAAQPLQWITDQLKHLVSGAQGKVTRVETSADGLQIILKTESDAHSYSSKRCILALGAKSKPFGPALLHQDKQLPLTTVFDLELLRRMHDENPACFGTVLVIGSSHSAALAVWNLLQCGIRVKQLMNKPYKYYYAEKTSSGFFKAYHDNTGLKGFVATFTKELEAGSEYSHLWSREYIKTDSPIDFLPYSHFVCAIGQEAAETLLVSDLSPAKLSYNTDTTQTIIPGIFVVGAGHPRIVKDCSGEYAANVGVSKFWPDISHTVVNIWQENPAPCVSFLGLTRAPWSHG